MNIYTFWKLLTYINIESLSHRHFWRDDSQYFFSHTDFYQNLNKFDRADFEEIGIFYFCHMLGPQSNFQALFVIRQNNFEFI